MSYWLVIIQLAQAAQQQRQQQQQQLQPQPQQQPLPPQEQVQLQQQPGAEIQTMAGEARSASWDTLNALRKFPQR